MSHNIRSLLTMNRPCSCGKRHPVSLRALMMESGALSKLPETVSALGEYKHLVMISDDNTYAAAGKCAEAFLREEWLCDGRRLQSISLATPEGGLHATEVTVGEVMEEMGDCDLLVAVGAGTVHDITRYVATQMGVDFISVPTAASASSSREMTVSQTYSPVTMCDTRQSNSAVYLPKRSPTPDAVSA